MRISLVYPKLGGQLQKSIGLIMGSYDPPLGIMYLGSFLRKHEVKVNLIDLSFSKNWDEFKDELLKVQPDIVGISTLSPFFDQAILAASIVKKTLPGCKVIFGGAHPTALPQETIKLPEVDFIVVGEGEVTLLELMRALESNGKLSEVKGILYKENGQVFQTPPREPIQNLDEIPFPARDLLPTWEKYLAQIPFFPYIPPYTTIMGGRGCPFNCSFCQPVLRKLFGQKLRLRSPKNVLSDIDILVNQYKIKSLFFFDDTFTAVDSWAKEICDGFIERKWKLVWGVNSRVNTFSYGLAQKLKQAGCIYVAFGVESGSQKILNESLNKGITIEQIINAFDICKKVGLISSASLMIGSPGDTKETIQETISLVQRIKPDTIDVHFTTPTPGSYMFDQFKDSLITSQKNRYQVGGLSLSNLSKQDLEELHDELQAAWRNTKEKRKHYRKAVQTYFFGIASRGIRNPLKYFVLLASLAAENNRIIHKMLKIMKNIYLKLFL